MHNVVSFCSCWTLRIFDLMVAGIFQIYAYFGPLAQFCFHQTNCDGSLPQLSLRSYIQAEFSVLPDTKRGGTKVMSVGLSQT